MHFDLISSLYCLSSLCDSSLSASTLRVARSRVRACSAVPHLRPCVTSLPVKTTCDDRRRPFSFPPSHLHVPSLAHFNITSRCRHPHPPSSTPHPHTHININNTSQTSRQQQPTSTLNPSPTPQLIRYAHHPRAVSQHPNIPPAWIPRTNSPSVRSSSWPSPGCASARGQRYAILHPEHLHKMKTLTNPQSHRSTTRNSPASPA